MKNNYLKKFIKVLIWPIIFMIGSFLINYVFVAIFNSKEKVGMNNNEFLKYIKTLEYQEKLNNFINSKVLIITLITFVILFPILYNVYKKYKECSKFKINDIYISIFFGVSISLIYNILIFNLNQIFEFTDMFDGNSIPIIIQKISSGIIGPILEELVFRGIVYNKLKEFNKPMNAIIITSVIFGIIHTNPLNALYAFGVSFIFIFLYEKYKSIKAPILMHISLNTTIILMLDIIKINNIILNTGLVIISTIMLLILRKKIIKKE